MEAIILCGGMATRMRPFTEDIPKVLVKIKGKTILERQIDHLSKFGVNKFILATGYKSNDIANFIGQRYDVVISEEKEPLGTAGAIKRALKHIEGNNFFVVNGDDLTDLDYDKLKRFNEPTVALGQYRCSFGLVLTSGNDVITFQEKPTIPDLWLSLGAYYLNKDIDLPDKGSLEKDVFPYIVLKAHKHTGHWQTINTMKDIEDAEKEEWICK